MKIKKIKSKYTTLLIVVLLLVLAVSGYFYLSGKKNKGIDTINYGPPTKEQVDNGLVQKKQTIEREKTEKIPENTLNMTANAERINVQLTQKTLNDRVLTVRFLAHDITDNDLKCSVRIMKDGVEFYSNSASIARSGRVGICQGFDISMSKIQSGKYSITCTIYNTTKSGEVKDEVYI